MFPPLCTSSSFIFFCFVSFCYFHCSKRDNLILQTIYFKNEFSDEKMERKSMEWEELKQSIVFVLCSRLSVYQRVAVCCLMLLKIAIWIIRNNALVSLNLGLDTFCHEKWAMNTWFFFLLIHRVKINVLRTHSQHCHP